MCYQKITAAVFVAALFAASVSAKQPYRPWQAGTLARLEQGSCGFFPKCLELSIETEQYLYVCRWSRGRTARWQKDLRFRMIGPVEFAIDNDNVYIKGVRGKEYKTRLLEKIPIPDKSAYRPELRA